MDSVNVKPNHECTLHDMVASVQNICMRVHSRVPSVKNCAYVCICAQKSVQYSDKQRKY